MLRDARSERTLGWNITAGPGQTKAERLANNDPRLSLEERYGTHAGYVAAVKKAADNASCKGYLLTGAEAASDGTLPRCSGTVPAGRRRPAAP